MSECIQGAHSVSTTLVFYQFIINYWIVIVIKSMQEWSQQSADHPFINLDHLIMAEYEVLALTISCWFLLFS